MLNKLTLLKKTVFQGNAAGSQEFNPISAENQLLCSTFRICKKISKFAKIEFFIAKSSYIVKMFAKKNLSKK